MGMQILCFCVPSIMVCHVFEFFFFFFHFKFWLFYKESQNKCMTSYNWWNIR